MLPVFLFCVCLVVLAAHLFVFWGLGLSSVALLLVFLFFSNHGETPLFLYVLFFVFCSFWPLLAPSACCCLLVLGPSWAPKPKNKPNKPNYKQNPPTKSQTSVPKAVVIVDYTTSCPSFVCHMCFCFVLFVVRFCFVLYCFCFVHLCFGFSSWAQTQRQAKPFIKRLSMEQSLDREPIPKGNPFKNSCCDK